MSAAAAPERAGKAAAAWTALNERQRQYLTAIYHADQAAEAAMRRRRAQDWGPQPPAEEWRRQVFCIKAPPKLVGYTAIQQELRQGGVHDPGAGSSLAALERRALILTSEDMVEIGTPFGLASVPRVQVRLTTPGRATCRAGLQVPAATRPPRGQLSEWLWRWLCRIYAAGEAGLPERAVSDSAQRALEQTRQRLAAPGAEPEPTGLYFDLWRNRMEQSLPGWLSSSDDRLWRLTPAGLEHYRAHWAGYRQRYPEVPALDPGRPVAEQVKELLQQQDRERAAVAAAYPEPVRRVLEEAIRTGREAGHLLTDLERRLGRLQEPLPDLAPDRGRELQEPTRRYLAELRRWRLACAQDLVRLAARLVAAVAAGGDAAAALPPHASSRPAGLPRVRTRLPGLDVTIEEQHQVAAGGDADQAEAYGRHLASLLSSGELARALLQAGRPIGGLDAASTEGDPEAGHGR